MGAAPHQSVAIHWHDLLIQEVRHEVLALFSLADVPGRRFSVASVKQKRDMFVYVCHFYCHWMSVDLASSLSMRREIVANVL
jgi:hypothetical protein